MDESSHNNVLNNLFRPVTVNVQWRPDDLIIYKCKTNYILTKGSKRRICKSDGQWTGMHPRCIGKYINFATFYVQQVRIVVLVPFRINS